MIKTLGQINFEASAPAVLHSCSWEFLPESSREFWELAANAVAKAERERCAPIVAALREAISLRVVMWRHGDAYDEDAHIPDAEIARKDSYAKKWLAAIEALTDEVPK